MVWGARGAFWGDFAGFWQPVRHGLPPSGGTSPLQGWGEERSLRSRAQNAAPSVLSCGVGQSRAEGCWGGAGHACRRSWMADPAA